MIRVAARLFYSGPCPPESQTRGLGVLLLDYLTTVQWVSFKDLAEATKIHPSVLTQALRFLEAGHMVRRLERRERRPVKASVGDDKLDKEDKEAKEEKERSRSFTVDYYVIDYYRAFDALQAARRLLRVMDLELAPLKRVMTDLQVYAVPVPDAGELCDWMKSRLATTTTPDIEWEDVA
ncbi:hypothetical protein TSOC_013976 [Tetrabaena socialis]|uniref:Uncharacterized protein n=1 Tax=Tetrabaena socialis TaxID=47790 RepID=A0A2J7ZIW9_9CHLO|nr:hypothetical protein TSOC_013976 [Tetrabaena socialis]|eukprot:PNH00212.1 hypothetical protein TSOC_013976 [Tetrabaena socialis]